MLGWQRRLTCTLWVWWRGAQVSLCAADDLPTICHFKCLQENPCLKLTRVCSLPPDRRSAESPLPRGLSSVLPVPQLEGGAYRTNWRQPQGTTAFCHTCSIAECCAPCNTDRFPHLCLPLQGYGERSERVQKWTTGSASGSPALDQSDLPSLCLFGRVPGDWRARRWRGGAERVPAGEDVSTHREVHFNNYYLTHCKDGKSFWIWQLCLPQGAQSSEAIQVQPPSGLLQSPLDVFMGYLIEYAQTFWSLQFDILIYT